jgi:hypothetical protein
MHGVEEEEERARPMAGEVETCRRQEGWSHEQRAGGEEEEERTNGW